MSESTLSMGLGDLESEVGLFLGYGRGADAGDTAWTTYQQGIITSVVKSGVRQFYFPPPLEGESVSYDWSFLKPMAALSLNSGLDYVDLPDDFGGLEGRITCTPQGSSAFWPVDVTGVGRVYAKLTEYPSTTGRPVVACVEPLRDTGASRSSRSRLKVWPTADQAYTLKFQYYLQPDALTDALPYAYGGLLHAETVLESCLSIAEQRLDDSASVHTLKFQERLAASINADRKLKPQKLGYNRDLSDGPEPAFRRHWDTAVKVGGVAY